MTADEARKIANAVNEDKFIKVLRHIHLEAEKGELSAVIPTELYAPYALHKLRTYMESLGYKCDVVLPYCLEVSFK